MRFDAIVIGAGPAGETVASRLPAGGLKVCLVERELIGGECAYWACIPSKTLLRAPEAASAAARTAGTSKPSSDWSKLAAYRDYMIRNLDDSGAKEGYEKQGVEVRRGRATLDGPGRVKVGDELLESERIVIATGSEPVIPPIDGLEQAGYWTNREATTIKQVPRSVTVLGGGPVGIELSQLLRRLGAEVHLLEASDRLLSREHPRVSELLHNALAEDGVDIRVNANATAVERAPGGRTVHLESADQVTAEELIVATSRKPRVDGLGLETIGLDHNLTIDARCRVAEGVWAIGDVTGTMPFTHVAKYQGRIVCADIAGEEAKADYTGIPRVVFSDPEVAAVGETEGGARIELADAIARPYTYETEPRGELGVIADPSGTRLVGAWAVAPLAGEWIHYAALAIKAQVPIAVLKDTVAQFPTYCEGYLRALDELT
jgi:dihydrolipoamide dehydrogenase